MNLLSPKPPGRFSPERLFRPDSVAVIGATSAEGAQVMANLMEGGFKGAILPVEPSIKAVSGVLAYPDVASLPVAPDVAVIASAPESVAAALEALAARGVFAAIVISMVPDLAEIAQRTGVRVVGPGSFGLVVTTIGFNASRGHIAPQKGRLALVSQSAGLCRAVLDWAEPNGIGFSHIVGLGSGGGSRLLLGA
jgi:acetyltransferase